MIALLAVAGFYLGQCAFDTTVAAVEWNKSRKQLQEDNAFNYKA